MQTTITQVTPVEYELEIRADAEDFAPELQKALQAQRARATFKGFRPGKVPLTLVKKMYGRALAYEIAERRIQQTFEAEVLDADRFEVLGQPKITRLDYEMDGELHAVVRFGVRPEIELKDLSAETVTKLVHPVGDKDIDEAIDNIRRREADLQPLDAPIESDDTFVTIELQQLDDATGSPIIGAKEEEEFFLDDERLKDELRDALKGKKAGDTFRVDLPHEGDHGHDEPAAPASGLIVSPYEEQRPEGHGHGHSHTHRFQVTVKEVKQRELPEIDEAFIQKATQQEAQDEAGLRAYVRKRLEEAWEKRSRELTEGRMVERMLALHPVPVPESVVEMYQDSFVEDLKQRYENKLPADFDEEAFRQGTREEAERQARWMLLRDAFVRQEGIEVTDEELQAYFEKEAENYPDISAAALRQFYKSVPRFEEQLQQRLLSEKVFDRLAQRFSFEEKDVDAYNEEMEAREQAQEPG